ncbi:MAG TPA: inositol monophosphatase family protein [bacterium]|nr:inositol monophosphatase family protein [bacterium]HPN30605.1 inositol monophosphatase family protein [bacterium]
MRKEKLNKTIELAKSAGKILIENFRKINQNEIYFKNPKDIVTEIDKKTENFIVSEIARAYPEDNIIAEEDSVRLNHIDSNLWIIDPLDGTTNYLHGIPYFAVSIAYYENNEPEIGVVYIPALDETFYAQKNQGAYLNGEKISVSSTNKLINSLAVTGFACIRADKPDNNLENFNRIAPKLREIRRFGAAAADGCYVACGRFDFFWEKYLRKWDIAASTLIVREAGGKVTDFSGKENNLDGKNIIMSNSVLHNELLTLIK